MCYDELGDVVADAAGAVRAQMAQVLAQLGRVDAGGRRQLLGGDRGHSPLTEAAQDAVIDGQSRDGCVRNPAYAAYARWAYLAAGHAHS